ncbi:ThiF family adenylyltransferase [Sphaerisporangium sp. NPDC088356]|uniref:ThiF family adenylyltransferase n=1 Tax=Sphaerisporangium sp. NPDC088356 TaxID=3154871 RepID=UPI00343611F1
MSIPPLVEPTPLLDDAETRRQAHQLILAGHGSVGQRRLKNAKVLVVSADEAGGPAVAHLADAGIGTIGIADGAPLQDWDRYMGSPAREGLGEARAVAWRAALRATYPTLEATAYTARPDASNIEETVRGYDVVVCAAEDPARCYLVDDVCARLGKPFVWGEMEALGGRAGVFWDAHGPTYRDLYPKPPTAYYRGMAGTMPAVGAWLGVTMTMEVVKLLTGQGRPLLGRLMRYDSLAGTSGVEPLARDPATSRPAELTAAEPFFGLLSPEAAQAARESTVSAEELRDMLDRRSDVVVVDVREPDEYAFAHLPDSVLIPKGEFFGGDGMARLPKDKRIVLLCRMGIRSAEVLAVVKGHGHEDAVHLGGGIIAWAQRIDPAMPTY